MPRGSISIQVLQKDGRSNKLLIPIKVEGVALDLENNFSMSKPKNGDIAIAMASIFNEEIGELDRKYKRHSQA